SGRRHCLRFPRGALVVLSLASLPAVARAGEQALTETGSTLMLPLLQSWAQGYTKVAPNARVTTAGTDSGAGIAAVINGTAQMGASDAYMSDVQVARDPGILNIPLAVLHEVFGRTVSFTEPLVAVSQWI